MPKVRPVPEGFNTVNIYLVVPDAVKAMEFYGKAFGAKPKLRMPGPDGKSTMHAEVVIGNSTLMLTDENPAWGMKGPLTLGGAGASVHVYVEDADALYQRAVKAGCEPTMPIMDAFWGDRYGKVKDPFGHEWGLATHKEDVAPEEMGRRAEEWFASMGGAGQ